MKSILTAFLVVSILGGAFTGSVAAQTTATGTIEITSVEDGSATAISTFDVIVADQDTGDVVHTAEGVTAAYTAELETGDYDVTVNADGHEPVTTAYTVTENTTTSNSYTLTANATTGSVDVTVEDSEATAVESADVYLVSPSGDIIDTATSDVDGLAQFTSVTADTGYTVDVQHADYADYSSDKFEVTDSTTTSITATLSAAGGALFSDNSSLVVVGVVLVVGYLLLKD